MYCNDKVGSGCVLGGVTMVSVIYWGFDDKYNLQNMKKGSRIVTLRGLEHKKIKNL